jgi:hypothetical protein
MTYKSTSIRFIEKTVKELQGGGSTMTAHIVDLKACALYLYNDLCSKIRNGSTGGKPFFLNKILSQSNIMKEVGGMKGSIDLDEKQSKDYLINYYHGQEMELRCPAEAKSLKDFTRKRNYIKDHVIEVVCKVYRLWHNVEGKRQEEEFIDLEELEKRVIETVKKRHSEI